MPNLYKEFRANLKPKSTPSRPTSSQGSTPAVLDATTRIPSGQQLTPNERRLSNVTCEPPVSRDPKPSESLQVPVPEM